MGAQLTLYPTSNGPGVDSARSLSSDFKSTYRNAVFWMPKGATAYLSLTNASATSILVHMKCRLLADTISIASKSTIVRNLASDTLGLSASGGGAPQSCEMVSDGAIGALRPVGTVTAAGYAAPIRFYDPQTATFANLTAVGLETAATTLVSVHNVTDTPLTFTPILREAALNKTL